MKNYTATYYTLRILQWFFAIAVLCSSGGYAGYIASEVKNTTTALVVVAEKHPEKTASYKNVSKEDQGFPSGKKNSLAFIAIQHTKFTLTKIKNYAISVSSLDRLHTYSIRPVTYTEEEDSFYFPVG